MGICLENSLPGKSGSGLCPLPPTSTRSTCRTRWFSLSAVYERPAASSQQPCGRSIPACSGGPRRRPARASAPRDGRISRSPGRSAARPMVLGVDHVEGPVRAEVDPFGRSKTAAAAGRPSPRGRARRYRRRPRSSGRARRRDGPGCPPARRDEHVAGPVRRRPRAPARCSRPAAAAAVARRLPAPGAADRLDRAAGAGDPADPTVAHVGDVEVAGRIEVDRVRLDQHRARGAGRRRRVARARRFPRRCSIVPVRASTRRIAALRRSTTNRSPAGQPGPRTARASRASVAGPPSPE